MHAIRQLREATGMGQKELAEKLRVSQPTVSDWENGRKKPATKNMEAIANLFGVSMDYLLQREQPSSVKIPVLGRVAAGLPISAAQDILDYEEITPDMARRGEFFALQIHGESMEPKISDGDVVIVRQQCMVDSGEIAIVMVGKEEATCKRILLHEQGISLISTNPKFRPMTFSAQDVQELPVCIIGKVVELRAKFE